MMPKLAHFSFLPVIILLYYLLRVASCFFFPPFSREKSFDFDFFHHSFFAHGLRKTRSFPSLRRGPGPLPPGPLPPSARTAKGRLPFPAALNAPSTNRASLNEPQCALWAGRAAHTTSLAWCVRIQELDVTLALATKALEQTKNHEASLRV
jgi:hypothetical protein